MKRPLYLIIAALLALFICQPAPGFAQDEKPRAKRHPSYSLRGLDEPTDPQSILNPNFVVNTESRLAETSVWYSSYIPERLVGLDVGDVDNDGKNELVFATAKNVSVARYDGTTYTLLATYALPGNSTIISLDLFDADMNGGKEIFVSAQKSTNKDANSYVLSYKGGKTIEVLGSGINYYLRVIGEEGKKTLVAQKPGTNSSQAYSGGVHYASFADGDITLASKVELPSGVDIYNFNIGELGADRALLTAHIRFPTEHLVLVDSAGGRVWESHDEYGGSTNHLERLSYGDTGRNVEYLPTRILIADIDKDGSNELIVAKNILSSTRVFKNLRSFNAGSIEARKFINLSLVHFFDTANTGNVLPGPAVDYQLADFDNNGTKDLIAAVVIVPGSGILEDARSVIYSYNNLYKVEPEAAPPTLPAGGSK
jgi:hypothetical protein